jgi:primosomal protein N' (replication factor Y) (superfamily II helicase)
MNTCSGVVSAPFAEIAPDARLGDRRATLTYRVPAHLDDIEVGQLIWIPLRNKLVLGVVVERHTREPASGVTARDIHAAVEPTFCLTPIQWRLAVWIAEETICSLYEAASLMLPPGVGSRAVEYLSLDHEPTEEERQRLTRAQRQLVEFLNREGEVTLDRAQRAQKSSLVSVIPALEAAGLLRRVARVRHRPPDDEPPRLQVRLVTGASPPPARAPRQVAAFTWLSPRLRARPDGALPIEAVLANPELDRAILRALADRGCIVIEPAALTPNGTSTHATDVVLTREQRRVWDQILRVLRDQSEPRPTVLLHGVTGSGKTELYLRTAAETLNRGRSAVVLVPEIALSGQIAERFRQRFGDRAVVLHSALHDRERYQTWQRAASGEPLVVVGPRSALFAPLPNVGAVILDEEHDSSYKQDTVPRYHARAVARELARLHEALVVLGSATPDVETFHASEGHDWLRLTLAERVGQRTLTATGDVMPVAIPLPVARIVDMRAELRAGRDSIFSRHLQDTIARRLAAREQTILFLNRRGASTLVQCRTCGTVTQCPFCDIPLVFHRTVQRVVCHRCGHRGQPPERCVSCGSTGIGYYGTGTQRVETEIQALFPQARILRWDQDALRGNVTHESLLASVVRQEADIIVGTQMVSKGLDLPNVTAVGVINADTYLYLPDLRAAERTFQMLTQVAGRAGRRAAGGEVVFQTYSPEHYAITSAAVHDYAAFYTEEIAYRRRHGYPPFKRLARLLYRHTDETQARAEVEAMAERLELQLLALPEIRGIDLLGPAPAFSTRVRGQYGWQLLVRGDQLVTLLSTVHVHAGWVVDVDPVNML